MPKEQTEPLKNDPSHDDFPSTISAASYTEPDFQERLHDLQNTAHDLDELSNQADALIADFSTHELEESVFTYRDASIHLDKVLKAMLFYANDAGGEPARRYVASAIVASSRLGSIPRLRALGITWITHFLYVCEYLCCLPPISLPKLAVSNPQSNPAEYIIFSRTRNTFPEVAGAMFFPLPLLVQKTRTMRICDRSGEMSDSSTFLDKSLTPF